MCRSVAHAVLQTVDDFLGQLAERVVSPAKPTRRTTQGKTSSSSSSKIDPQQLLHVALDPPRESSTASWCRELGIDQDVLRQQLVDIINVSGGTCCDRQECQHLPVT
jgi:hypothetical protein